MKTPLKKVHLPAVLAMLGLLLAVIPNAYADYQIAQVSITSPASGQVVTNQLLNVTGSVTRFSNSAAVSNVLVQINGGGWVNAETANSWTNWNVGPFVLAAGNNTVSAYLVDINGNVSATNSVTFAYFQPAVGSRHAYRLDESGRFSSCHLYIRIRRQSGSHSNGFRNIEPRRAPVRRAIWCCSSPTMASPVPLPTGRRW